MLNGLDLFSGIGGISLALSDWVCSVAYCESDLYAQSVLLSRMERVQLPAAPIWDDVRTLCREVIRADIDIIYGGFPCQDISVAGDGQGLAGKRSGLVSEIFRLVGDIRPAFIFLENVPAIRTRGAELVVKTLARQRYDCRWDVVSAAEVGAPHLRKRWFLLAADTNSFPLRNQQQWLSGRREDSIQTERESKLMGSCQAEWRKIEPDLYRVDDGLPEALERFRALGNAVVPLQARTAFKRLMGLQ